MKKRGALLFWLIVFAMLLLTACGTTYALEIEDAPKPPELVFADGMPLYLTRATEELLNGFAEHLDLSFLADGDLRIVFVSNRPIYNFSFLEVRYDNGFCVENVLFAQKELLPHRPVVATWTGQGDTSHRAVSFVCENGETRYFVLEVDHAGMFSLREFDRITDSQRLA